MPIEEINFDYVDESTNCKGVLFYLKAHLDALQF